MDAYVIDEGDINTPTYTIYQPSSSQCPRINGKNKHAHQLRPKINDKGYGGFVLHGYYDEICFRQESQL